MCDATYRSASFVPHDGMKPSDLALGVVRSRVTPAAHSRSASGRDIGWAGRTPTRSASEGGHAVADPNAASESRQPSRDASFEPCPNWGRRGARHSSNRTMGPTPVASHVSVLMMVGIAMNCRDTPACLSKIAPKSQRLHAHLTLQSLGVRAIFAANGTACNL